MAERKPLRIAVIGAGGMARRVHLPSLQELDGVEVVAICDLVEERAGSLAGQFGIPGCYTSQERMLSETTGLDGALCLVEPAGHYHVVRRCLEAGLPTFMEKPPGITAFQAASLDRAAGAAGVILQVGFNRRSIPLVRRVLEMVRERTSITQIEGRFMKNGTGAFDAGSVDAFASDTVHCVDLVRWIAGSEAEAVATAVGSYEEAHDNAWNSVLRFANGVTATVRANYRTGGRVHTFEVHGPGASAFIDLGTAGFGCRATVILGRGREGYSLSATGSGKPEVIELDGMEIAGSDAFHKYYGFFQEVEEFVRCVREGTAPACGIAEAARSMALVERIRGSRI